MYLKSNINFIMRSSIKSIKQPNPTRIFQSPYLTDAIIDDSCSTKIVASRRLEPSWGMTGFSTIQKLKGSS